MRYVLDRLEGDHAVLIGCDTEETVCVPITELVTERATPKKGDVFDKDASLFRFSETETAARRQRNLERFRRLFKHD